jgi:hypothetical protein
MSENPHHPYPVTGSLLISSPSITRLNGPEIFVFGSNNHGRHGKGAAKQAVDHFGAIHGQAEGLQGKSYGLPTVKCAPHGPFQGRQMSLPEIHIHVRRFLEYARQQKNLLFLVTEVGCGLGGHQKADIARLFWKDLEGIPFNVQLPESFIHHGPPHEIRDLGDRKAAFHTITPHGYKPDGQ